MGKCNICGAIQKEKWDMSVSFINKNSEATEIPQLNTTLYDFDISTDIKDKSICDNCMHIHNAIKALENNINFSWGNRKYYADGRNLY